MSRRAKTRREHVTDAARAHTNLTMFAAVVELLEGGCIYGTSAAARRIIAICQKEQQRYLRAYDRARAEAEL